MDTIPQNDSQYFMSEIEKKINSIMKTIKNLKEEIKDIKEDVEKLKNYKDRTNIRYRSNDDINPYDLASVAKHHKKR